jgi:hypothetical protein
VRDARRQLQFPIRCFEALSLTTRLIVIFGGIALNSLAWSIN